MTFEPRFNYVNNNSATTSASWNELLNDGGLTGVLDFNTGLATAVDFINVSISPLVLTTIGAGGSPCSGPAAWVDTNANQTGWQLPTTWGQQEFRNLDPGKTYTIEAYGLSSSGTTKTLETRCNGGTVSSINVVQNFTQVTQHTGVSPDASGVILFEARDGGGGAYIGAVRVYEESAPATLALTAADNITTEGATATFTLAGNAAAPTAARLNGTDLGTLTDQGSGVYSYTTPLLADDATATLEVDVDSTTLSTTISYANSYDLVLTNHGTPDPNSVMYGNQFATTGPVELKVITDTNPDIVVIDWPLMSSAQEWLTDILQASSVTKVGDGETSFELAFFVPETGQTGTFGGTITTQDVYSPAIDSVDVPAIGTYHAGDDLVFLVNWNEPVAVTGTPGLNINLGGSVRQANYSGGSGSSVVEFTYPVQAGDAANGVAVLSLSLDGGTIADPSGNDAFLTLNGVGDASAVVVDALPAQVVSVAVPADGTYTAGQSLDLVVSFDAPVTVTGSPVLVLGLGVDQVAAALVSGSTTADLTFSYTVQAGDNAPGGIEVAGLSLAGGAIADQYGVPVDITLAGVADATGVIVDALGPVISVNSARTSNTAPLVSGAAGDAVSLSLVVDGVTYTPVPSAGQWVQQLPALAIGDYAMELTGTDAAGNQSTDSGTLQIVEAVVAGEGGLFRTLFRTPFENVNPSPFR